MSARLRRIGKIKRKLAIVVSGSASCAFPWSSWATFNVAWPLSRVACHSVLVCVLRKIVESSHFTLKG